MFKTTKVSFNHIQSLAIMQFNRPYMIFISLPFNYISIEHHFWDIVDYFPKFKEVTWLWPYPLNKHCSIWRLIIHMANQCTKFDVSSICHSRHFRKFKMGHITWPHSFQGQFVICRLGLAMVNLHTKFEVSKFTQYENMKGNAKCRNWGGFRG